MGKSRAGKNKRHRHNGLFAPKQNSCSWCGRTCIHDRVHCPAKDQKCNNCGKLGHFKAVCRSPAKVGGVSKSEPEEDSIFLGAVRPHSDETWAIELTLQGKLVTLQFNTGAEVTIISDTLWREVGQPKLTQSERTLHGPDACVIPTLGKFCGTFTHNDRRVESEVYVAKRLTKSLLAW